MIKSNLFTVWKRREAEMGYTLTYRGVAAATGLSTATLRRWVSDSVERYDKGSLEALCDYFGCEVKDLIVRS